MLEKLLLAVTITFSLNLFFQVRVPHQTNTGANTARLRNFLVEASRGSREGIFASPASPAYPSSIDTGASYLPGAEASPQFVVTAMSKK